MVYQEVLPLLSQYEIGVVLIGRNDRIAEANEAADRLLHGDGRLKQSYARDILPPDIRTLPEGYLFNVGFQEYLEVCAPPDMSCPAHLEVVCFRSATERVLHHMMSSIVDLIPEPIIMADERERVLFINDATMRMESLLPEDVVGKEISSVYPNPDTLTEDNVYPELTVPLVLRTGRPVLNARQTYETLKGKRLDIMCNSYPVFLEDRILGVFCVTADSSRIDILGKRILELQEKLLENGNERRSPKKGQLTAKYRFSDIIHGSKMMADTLQRARMSAKSNSPVMICGETGTGKEMFAQGIHNESARADKPFIAINCAAIPENLLESLLFGTEKGAYTGAEKRAGLFEQADGGTLFLDELNSMGLNLQAKLLRVLQDGVVRRVGGTKEFQVDVRILSAMNIPPYEAIHDKKLREDLYYRLGVVSITIPPLRKRREDIQLLARVFFRNLDRKLSKNVTDISPDALTMLYAYDWPGNVRELEHCIEHAMNMLPDNETMLPVSALPDHILERFPDGAQIIRKKTGTGSDKGILESYLTGLEYNLLTDYLKKNRGNITRTANQLGISRQNLQHRLKHHRIDPSLYAADKKRRKPASPSYRPE